MTDRVKREQSGEPDREQGRDPHGRAHPENDPIGRGLTIHWDPITPMSTGGAGRELTCSGQSGKLARTVAPVTPALRDRRELIDGVIALRTADVHLVFHPGPELTRLLGGARRGARATIFGRPMGLRRDGRHENNDPHGRHQEVSDE